MQDTLCKNTLASVANLDRFLYLATRSDLDGDITRSNALFILINAFPQRVHTEAVFSASVVLSSEAVRRP